jgi:hypothetical protein
VVFTIIGFAGCARVEPIDLSKRDNRSNDLQISPITDKILAGGDVVQRKEVYGVIPYQPHRCTPAAKQSDNSFGLFALFLCGGGLVGAVAITWKLVRKHAGINSDCDGQTDDTGPTGEKSVRGRRG